MTVEKIIRPLLTVALIIFGLMALSIVAVEVYDRFKKWRRRK